jgi:hypothetical protein
MDVTVEDKRLTCTNGSLTSQTACLEPTENSRSSFVIESQYWKSARCPAKLLKRAAHLVDHHDSQEHTQTKEEYPIDIMTNSIANLGRESEKQNAANDVERNAEKDISDNPSIIKCSNDEYELRDSVDHNADSWEEEVGDE